MPVNCASWSTTITLRSASPGSVSWWACLDPRSTTVPHRCVNRRCGSWPGSMLSIWRIPAAAVAGWWTTWPEKGSRSAVTACETSCAAWAYGRSTRSRALRFQATQPRNFHAWWISVRSRLWIRCGPPTSPTSLSRRVFSNWWRSWMSSPGTCSAGNSPTALTRSSVCMPWIWRWGDGRKPEVFHSDQGCKFTSSPFIARLRAEEIKISWSGRKRCYDNILVERLW
jgi:hypothetical protein